MAAEIQPEAMPNVNSFRSAEATIETTHHQIDAIATVSDERASNIDEVEPVPHQCQRFTIDPGVMSLGEPVRAPQALGSIPIVTVSTALGTIEEELESASTPTGRMRSDISTSNKVENAMDAAFTFSMDREINTGPVAPSLGDISSATGSDNMAEVLQLNENCSKEELVSISNTEKIANVPEAVSNQGKGNNSERTPINIDEPEAEAIHSGEPIFPDPTSTSFLVKSKPSSLSFIPVLLTTQPCKTTTYFDSNWLPSLYPPSDPILPPHLQGLEEPNQTLIDMNTAPTSPVASSASDFDRAIAEGLKDGTAPETADRDELSLWSAFVQAAAAAGIRVRAPEARWVRTELGNREHRRQRMQGTRRGASGRTRGSGERRGATEATTTHAYRRPMKKNTSTRSNQADAKHSASPSCGDKESWGGTLGPEDDPEGLSLLDYTQTSRIATSNRSNNEDEATVASLEPTQSDQQRRGSRSRRRRRPSGTPRGGPDSATQPENTLPPSWDTERLAQTSPTDSTEVRENDSRASRHAALAESSFLPEYSVVSSWEQTSLSNNPMAVPTNPPRTPRLRRNRGQSRGPRVYTQTNHGDGILDTPQSVAIPDEALHDHFSTVIRNDSVPGRTGARLGRTQVPTLRDEGQEAATQRRQASRGRREPRKEGRSSRLAQLVGSGGHSGDRSIQTLGNVVSRGGIVHVIPRVRYLPTDTVEAPEPTEVVWENEGMVNVAGTQMSSSGRRRRRDDHHSQRGRFRQRTDNRHESDAGASVTIPNEQRWQKVETRDTEEGAGSGWGDNVAPADLDW